MFRHTHAEKYAFVNHGEGRRSQHIDTMTSVGDATQAGPVAPPEPTWYDDSVERYSNPAAYARKHAPVPTPELQKEALLAVPGGQDAKLEVRTAACGQLRVPTTHKHDDLQLQAGRFRRLICRGEIADEDGRVEVVRRQSVLQLSRLYKLRVTVSTTTLAILSREGGSMKHFGFLPEAIRNSWTGRTVDSKRDSKLDPRLDGSCSIFKPLFTKRGLASAYSICVWTTLALVLRSTLLVNLTCFLCSVPHIAFNTSCVSS